MPDTGYMRLARRFYRDIPFFGKALWGSDQENQWDFYYKPFAPFHYEIFDELRKTLDPVKNTKNYHDTHKQATLIQVPRGHAKTKCVELYGAWAITFGLRKYWIIASKSKENKVEETFEDLKTLFTSDPYVELFGDVRGDYWSNKKLNVKFQKGKLKVDAIIEARSPGSHTVGASRGSARPDLWWIDDVEDTKTVKNKSNIDKLESWFDEEVEPGLEPINQRGRRGQIIITTTPYSAVDSFAIRLERKKMVKTIRYSIWDKEAGTTLWPERFSFNYVMQKYQDAVANGSLNAWYAQQEMNPKQAKAVRFLRDEAKHVSAKEAQRKLRSRVEKGKVHIFVDAAYARGRNACMSGIVVSSHYPNGEFDILESHGEQWNAAELFDKCYELWALYKEYCDGVYIETKQFDMVSRYFHETSLRKKKLGMNVFKLTDKNMGKAERIALLVPYYKLGVMRFVEDKNNQLLNQLWTWTGEDKEWDIADACAYNILATELISTHAREEREEKKKEEKWKTAAVNGMWCPSEETPTTKYKHISDYQVKQSERFGEEYAYGDGY